MQLAGCAVHMRNYKFTSQCVIAVDGEQKRHEGVRNQQHTARLRPLGFGVAAFAHFATMEFCWLA